MTLGMSTRSTAGWIISEYSRDNAPTAQEGPEVKRLKRFEEELQL